MSIVVERMGRACFALMLLLLVAGIGWAILSLPPESNGLSAHVFFRLDESGVRSPVTAVLLNFRGYDTLLEIGVLLVAAIGVRALAADRIRNERSHFAPPGPVLTGLLRVIAPLTVVVAGYLLWAGGHAPGGAFQAGAVLASLGVLLLLGNPNMLLRVPDWLQRVLLSAGLLVFVGVGLMVMALDASLLQYPPRLAKWLILLIEAFCALSIAAVLTVLFAGGKIASSRDDGWSMQPEKGQ